MLSADFSVVNACGWLLSKKPVGTVASLEVKQRNTSESYYICTSIKNAINQALLHTSFIWTKINYHSLNTEFNHCNIQDNHNDYITSKLCHSTIQHLGNLL